MAATDGLSLDRIVLVLLVEGDVEQRLFVVLVVTVGGGAPALYGPGSATMKSACADLFANAAWALNGHRT